MIGHGEYKDVCTNRLSMESMVGESTTGLLDVLESFGENLWRGYLNSTFNHIGKLFKNTAAE